MAKDPAFLFYSADFQTGTQFMSDEQVGKYIRLLCAQHQHGHLKHAHMLNICKDQDDDIFSKFKVDVDGLYYNDRLDKEVLRRIKYSESRKHNISSRYKDKHVSTYEPACVDTYEGCMKPHMETETETETETITEAEKTAKIDHKKFIETFLKFCPSLPKPTQLSDKRKKLIKKWWLKYPEWEFWENFWTIVEGSDFLSGRNGTGRFGMDWFLEKESNFLKTLEGNYDHR